ncbi:glutathione S-transferase [Saccharospirillum sp. MSK14-1]|uniref:glutathione S-transferase n=1 Tax=Saccharospirillum sp. MSK14-1 TaxID=1897632 RepID=UPI000D3B2F47|nr:glutathione S-transferase [Saccharospirillum sp. MSK14-1]PTY35657.1 glutathione S-transferase [Saccharospirillum sp. MSK14-1]
MSNPETLVVHHLEYSRSHRVLWLLEEMGRSYEVKRYPRNASWLAPKELREVHPLGKSPVLTLNDQTLAESGAILESLVEENPDCGLGIAPGESGRSDYLYWLHYAEGSLMPLMVMTVVFRKIPQGKMPFFIRPIARMISQKAVETFLRPQVTTHLKVLNDWLGGRDWLAGDKLTAADIQMSFPLEAAASRFGLNDYPAIQRYLERLRARPAYQRALEKGGPMTPA